MANIFLKFISSVNRLFIFLGLRGNPDYWGTVYDSISKQPIDPALVKLVEASTGKVVGSCTTDLFGHYSFLIYPGKFKILVQRTNYLFPSKRQLGDKDGMYEHLYHGEFFEVSGETDLLNFNIPMDPLRPDWNQQAKGGVAKTHPLGQRALILAVALVFWAGLAATATAYYYNPSFKFLLVLSVYAVIFLLRLILPPVRLWGRVILPEGVNYLDLQVQLAHAELQDILMGKSLVFPDGKFYLRAPRGRYILKVASRTVPGREDILLNKKVAIGWEGVVNQKFKIPPS